MDGCILSVAAMRHIFRTIIKAWQRIELKHINDAIADELDRERNHARTIRHLQMMRADLLWHLRSGVHTHSGLAVWPKERRS